MSTSEPSQARILVVESVPSLRTILLALVTEEGYVATGLASLEQTLRELEKQSYQKGA